MTNKREPGYYWVKWGEKWIICLYHGEDKWLMFNERIFCHSSTFTKIGSRITPEMRYTEDDMIEFAITSEFGPKEIRDIHQESVEKSVKNCFDYWLK